MVRVRIVGVLAAVLLALGCGGQPSDDGGQNELVLRGYSTPGRAEAWDEAISRILFNAAPGEQRIGSVEVGPDGRLLVLAPRSVHEGLAELIESRSEAAAADAPSSVVTTYWFVAGHPSHAPPKRGDQLRNVASALDEIEKVQGPQEFRLIERLVLRQAEGVRSSARSPLIHVLQEVTTSDGRFVADVQVDPSGPTSINTTVNVRADQLLVLAQLGLDETLDPWAGQGTRHGDTTLYVILRAQADART
jgi:hypothetical protein